MKKSLRNSTAVAVVAAVLASVALVWPLSDSWFEDLSTRVVVDRDGVVLAEQVRPNRGRGAWVELDEVAPVVVDALLAAEDDRFEDHFGIDHRAVARALWVNARAGRTVQGGSTISQQTARLLAGRPPGLIGKGVEAARTLRLEYHLEKDEILTWYLNRAYFGANAWGIEAAARATFDESAAGLSLSEAATLVGLLPAPSRLHPHKSRRIASQARDRVLDRMVITGRLSAEAAEEAKREPLELRTPHRERVAHHFAMRLLAESPEASEIRSTLDGKLQRDVEDLVDKHLAELVNKDVDHAAVVVLDVETGAVRAWVGSGDLWAEDGQVDGARAPRSPGSTLKPFLYGLAFESGATPADVLADIPKAYRTSHGTWTPQNYSGRFHGPVRAREALACSFNVPAVVLLEQVGVSTLMDRLHEIGLGPPERPAHYGLGLILGDAEVSLDQLTNAYAGLARGGILRPIRSLESTTVGDGTRFLEPAAAWWVTDILSDPVARLQAFGRYGPLEREYPVAAKTGTSTGFRDNWTVGYTGEWAVGVWVGNFDGRPMGDVSGVTGAGPLWADIMDRVTNGWSTPFADPQGVERTPICALSGLAAGRHCPTVVDEWLATSTHDCDWHTDSCAISWPSEFAAWAAESEPSAGCTSDGSTAIASPGAGATFYVDPRIPAERQRVPLRANTPAGARNAEWRVDGELVASVTRPFEALWLPLTSGMHRVELVVDGRAAAPVDVWIGGAKNTLE